MPNLRRAVMIGDADHKRATMLKEILNEEFGLEVECVETFEQVKDKLALSKYELVLIAHNLPYSYLAQDPIRPANISDLISDHLGQKVGLIKSELELRLGFKRLPNIFLIQVAQIKPLAKQPERIISELNKIFPNSWRLEKRLSKLSHSIELVLEDSPQLHEQIRSLSSSHDMTEGEMHFKQLVGQVFDCDKVVVEKLGQGKSGATVLRINPSKKGKKRDDFFIKISSNNDLPKIKLEVSKFLVARKRLGDGKYRFHGANLKAPDSRKQAEKHRSNAADEVDEFIVTNDRWNAICYEFLGGESFGEILDLETALTASKEELGKKTRTSTKFSFDPQNESQANQKRILIFETMLEWLCDNLYEEQAKKGDRVQRETRLIWNFEDAPVQQYDTKPPYLIAGRERARILHFINGSEASLGERFYTPNWEPRFDKVRQFLLGELKPKRLNRKMSVVLSPAHGDLNSNNILLWLNQADHPFLIDFPFYQELGHALQDLARLEVEIKFGLMDRQADSPRDQLLAFDRTSSQIFLWRRLEEHLLSSYWKDKIKNWQVPGYKKNVEFSLELIQIIRRKAVVVHQQYLKDASDRTFAEEYYPALLYHTLRAVGYESLPILKRLLAVYSAGLLIEKLSD